MNEIRSDLKVLGEATDWLERLQSGSASKTEVEAWLRWCDEDIAHANAFEQVRKLGSLARPLRDEFPLDAALAGDAEQSAWVHGRGGLTKAVRDGFRSFGRWAGRVLRPVPLTAATAALVAAMVVRIGDAPIERDSGDTSTQTIVLSVPAVADQAPARVPAIEAPVEARPKATSDLRETHLADGSAVQLATGSSVAVRYSKAERGVELQTGEAYFKVARDESRPFVVAAGEFTAQALGTAFNVRRAGNRVVVSVTEGLVAVSHRAIDGQHRSDRPIQIAAGSQLRWGGGDDAPIISPITAAEALGWQRGRLHYSEEPIGGVISDFNRYSARKARIGSDAIWHIRFTGTLFTDDTQEWLMGLPGVFPVRIIEDEQGFLITTIASEETSG